MKKTLMLFLFCAVCASCNNSGDEVSALKKENEQLHSEIAQLKNSGVKAGAVRQGQDSILDHAVIQLDTANNAIKEWRQYVNGGNRRDSIHHNVSFILNAAVLRNYILSDSNVTCVDVYISGTPNQNLSIIYVGATQNAATDSITELPFYYAGSSVPYVFDHGLPCPVCEKMGIGRIARSLNQ